MLTIVRYVERDDVVFDAYVGLEGGFPFGLVGTERAGELRLLAALLALVHEEVVALSVAPSALAHMTPHSCGHEHKI